MGMLLSTLAFANWPWCRLLLLDTPSACLNPLHKSFQWSRLCKKFVHLNFGTALLDTLCNCHWMNNYLRCMDYCRDQVNRRMMFDHWDTTYTNLVQLDLDTVQVSTRDTCWGPSHWDGRCSSGRHCTGGIHHCNSTQLTHDYEQL